MEFPGTELLDKKLEIPTWPQFSYFGPKSYINEYEHIFRGQGNEFQNKQGNISGNQSLSNSF